MTFVLVHGAWGGSYGFRSVRRLLQHDGDEVTTPSLTGIGERAHLASAQVTLSTHVQDVVNHVLYEDLDDIVLLGYSYGGAVVTGCIDHIGDRVRHLVFLDAFVPSDGQAVFDLVAPGAVRPTLELGAAWALPPTDREFEDPAEAVWNGPRRVGQPIGTFTEPVRITTPLEDHEFGLTYIRATGSPPNDPGNHAFAAAAAHASASSRWNYHEIDSNHMIPANRPGELADILRSLR